ncbi:MAG TPA: hypothetical protein VEF53_20290 [Patescibacteria group bacterium]|nr:hypothetical protein [Patescibacteria group bacterium]
MIYIKLFLTTVIFFPLVEMIMILIKKFLNNMLNTSFAADYRIIDFSYLIPFSLFFALIMMSSHVYITKAIRIDDKETELKNMKQVMDRMKWKMKEQTQYTLLFVSPIRLGLFMDEITVTFNDMEIEMNGPREYVEKAISRSNFLYIPYEIKNLKQEG